ncbi:phosphotransferase family protein [Methylocapsa acidiphila]|uniref:phosphotransferase family protein n=1 Tax=Methylocapsa acidiphila TaxID=133552 RepID=UPI000427337E|nr:aminoglycoside phosphotransferase family protein [Methylocapsa acidiphila]
MREKWGREQPELGLDRDGVERLLTAAFPSSRVVYHKRARGGLTNTNIEVGLAAAPWRVCLRLYQGNPKEAGKEAALNALLVPRGVPTARFLHFSPSNPMNGAPYAILEWVEGARLASAARGLDEKSQVALGLRLGATLAAIHAIRFDLAGRLDAELRICAPLDFGGEAVRAFARACFDSGILSARLGPEDACALVAFLEREADRLGGWLAEPRLIHGDFNASNILVRRDAGVGWTVAAALDWEFAFAGTPAFDFGNLLRPPLGDKPLLIDAAARGYVAEGGVLPKDWRMAAGIADLVAWVDVLRRDHATPGLIADAALAIQRIVTASL